MRAELGPRRQATITDVARKAGVSITTVSRIVNNIPRQVGADLRRRVLTAVRDLRYYPNALARSLHQHRTRTLGVLITDMANPYYAEIVRGIEDVARQRDYVLFVCNTDRDPDVLAQYITVLLERRADGVIVSGGGTPGRRHVEGLSARGLPTVLVGRYNLSLPAVRIDNVRGGWTAASHLIALGHRRIAVVSGPEVSTSIQDRLKGYRRALADVGAPLAENWVLPGDLRPATALRLVDRILSLNRRPTAILAANDQTAIATIRAAGQRGLRVPGDLSVVGFDNIELASYVNPALTTVGVPLYQVGRAAAEMMIRLIGGTPGERQVCFTPELIVRESTGPVSACRDSRARMPAGPAPDARTR